MNKKNVMRDFINEIYYKKMMTKFIINIFGYSNFNDYNYLFRMIDEDDRIIIDIYDNVSDNRFNRYIFSFIDRGYNIKTIEESNVFVSYISIIDSLDSDNNLLKLAYLFNLDDDKMLCYSKSFLDKDFILILSEIIKKPI